MGRKQARKEYTKAPERTKYWFETPWYIGGEYRESGRKVGAEKLGIFATLLYERSGMSIRNDVMPYTQFFGPVLD